ncbi:MAG: T9SS type A sorting domain-containing protein [Flavobacteriales bacterium]
MKHIFIAVSVIVSSLSAFAQSEIRTITHDGLQREYRLYVPSIYDGSEPVPLVLNLHGYTSNGFEQEVYGDFRSIADTANFILIHPEGTEDSAGDTFWNAFGSPEETVDDLGFLSDLIDSLEVEFNIDMQRVYSTGMSNGGFMSYKLACELSGKIAAIASVTGSMIQINLNACNPTNPIPVMQMHGTADPTVPYLGNSGPTGMVPIEDLVAAWAAKNGCGETPSVNAVADTDMTDGCTAEHWVYTGGDEHSTVEFYKIDGGEHTWPGSNPILTIGVTNRDFSASVEIWRFFSRYSLNGVVGIEDAEPTKNAFSIYPNPTAGSTTIQFKNAEKRLVQVRNTAGQLVREIRNSTSALTLDLADSGVYLVSVTTDKDTFTQKLIVE